MGLFSCFLSESIVYYSVEKSSRFLYINLNPETLLNSLISCSSFLVETLELSGLFLIELQLMYNII